MDINLVFTKKSGDLKTVPVPESVTIVGRGKDCDLCIPLPAVSRHHCQFNQDEGKITIRDLGSTNGTFINGQKVEEAQLAPGDQIKIGPITFTTQIDGQPEKIAPQFIDDPDNFNYHPAEMDQSGTIAQDEHDMIGG